MTANLEAILEAIQNVLDEDDLDLIIQKILLSAQKLLNAEAASLFMLNRKKKRIEMVAATNIPLRVVRKIYFPSGTGVTGWVAEHAESANVEDITKDYRFQSSVSNTTGFKTKGYLCVPLIVNENVIGTLQVLNKTKGERFDKNNQELLEGFAVVAALAIKKSQMHQVTLEKRRMQMELSVAKTFQKRLLPEDFYPPNGIKIAGLNRPARSMGGDIYDAFDLKDGYCVLLGDVSGSGPGAALWMATLSSLLHFIADQGKDPLDDIEIIDRHLSQQMPPATFITMFIGTIHNKTLRYTSAGHNPMPLLRKDGKLERLPASGLPLGLMPDVPRKIHSIPINNNDKLILYSDGITEAENLKGEMYGEQRLENILLKRQKMNPEKIVPSIFRSVKGFTAGVKQADDITILIIEF
ncbi:MAG: SpoIIE family protein phosphatase [Candidatus Electryonea clarkiae]|nr:SpoIIE family protein phosphatase [Candidatus Electryonea clarkiae]MDP8286448.1 SpoIIE family protein phosphatase [Candidatus Electryonea clarkiae]